MSARYVKFDLVAPISEEDGGEFEKRVANYAVKPRARFGAKSKWAVHGRNNRLPERMVGFAGTMRTMCALRRRTGGQSVAMTS